MYDITRGKPTVRTSEIGEGRNPPKAVILYLNTPIPILYTNFYICGILNFAIPTFLDIMYILSNISLIVFSCFELRWLCWKLGLLTRMYGFHEIDVYQVKGSAEVMFRLVFFNIRMGIMGFHAGKKD